MEEKSFVWTSNLTRKLFELRFEYDWLFKKKKQPWREFQRLLLKHGFPKEMTLNHLRKKWSYSYDSYRIAKRTKNRSWIYYKLFDKHYGNIKVLDKYASWTDELRLKLITAVCDAKELELNTDNMWKHIETLLRSQDLPLECCIQDIKGLWRYINLTFNRKHKIRLKNNATTSDWSLYDSMVDFFERYEPEYLINFDSMPDVKFSLHDKYYRKKRGENNEENTLEEFQWTKDITESFIQIRLRNDQLFKTKGWVWNEFLCILKKEYGFPDNLTTKDVRRKWSAIYGEYQKAKAKQNTSWLYYNLFELHLGEGPLSFEPILGWHETWVCNLIAARHDLENVFQCSSKDDSEGWREVEKRLRVMGIPLDHSLLDIVEIFKHLMKTFRWKKKFSRKGILTEHWPYFEPMMRFEEIQLKPVIKKPKCDLSDYNDDYVNDDDEDDDDMKLFDLKQKLQMRPKLEVADVNQCRSCCSEDGCVNIFDQRDDNGFDLAFKLRIVAGIEVEKEDNLPGYICLNCVNDLESAYRFRQKCQQNDKNLRSNPPKSLSIKVELEPHINDDDSDTHYDTDAPYTESKSDTEKKIKRESIPKKPIQRMRKKTRKLKYEYWKVCDICGKPTRNLKSHLDSHNEGKEYSCDICQKKFKFKSGLIVHRAVHDETPKKTCEVCGKSFYVMSQYRKHFVYHANERKYKCESCGKAFNTMDILRVHLRIHTDERPFSCQECGKTFRTAGCVSRHKRIVHKKRVKVS